MSIIKIALLILITLAAGYLSGPYADYFWARIHSGPQDNIAPSSPAIIDRCVGWAANTYQVPANVVYGIMYVEGGRNGQAVGNTNGTYDLGRMQINSLWVPQLSRAWGLDYHAAYKAIRDNDCANIYVGTWILKQKIIETGSLYQGIAYYHSATHRLGAAYANKVIVTMELKPPPLPQ